jgi:hypothetical protein
MRPSTEDLKKRLRRLEPNFKAVKALNNSIYIERWPRVTICAANTLGVGSTLYEALREAVQKAENEEKARLDAKKRKAPIPLASEQRGFAQGIAWVVGVMSRFQIDAGGILKESGLHYEDFKGCGVAAQDLRTIRSLSEDQGLPLARAR